VILPLREYDIDLALYTVRGVQQRNHRAYLSNRKKRAGGDLLQKIELSYCYYFIFLSYMLIKGKILPKSVVIMVNPEFKRDCSLLICLTQLARDKYHTMKHIVIQSIDGEINGNNEH